MCYVFGMLREYRGPQMNVERLLPESLAKWLELRRRMKYLAFQAMGEAFGPKRPSNVIPFRWGDKRL